MVASDAVNLSVQQKCLALIRNAVAGADMERLSFSIALWRNFSQPATWRGAAPCVSAIQTLDVSEEVQMERLLLRPAEAAEMIGIGRSKVYELLARGELPAIRIGGRLRIPVNKLRQWVSQKMREQEHAR